MNRRLSRQWSNREKIMLSFLVLLVTLNGLIILVSSNLKDFSFAFRSIVEDRLVPESELAHIQENLYENRVTLLEGITLREPVSQDIAQNNQEIEHLTRLLLQTELTPEEYEALQQYRWQMDAYREVESQVLMLIKDDSASEALQVFMQQGVPAFDRLQHTMRQLEDMQLVIGKELYQQANHTVRVIQMFGYLSLAIALIMTLYMLKVLHFTIK